MTATAPRQRGNTFVGIVIGLVLGLGIALAVAVYVTKVPVPFLYKGQVRTPEQDAAESRKNQNWDPNAPLYGKNPARPQAPASAAGGDAAAGSNAPAGAVAAPATGATGAEPKPPAVAGRPSGDPLGEFAASRSQAPAPSGQPQPQPGSAQAADPFVYFVQAGAFRTPEDAESQRAKLSLMGLEARVTEREQSGRQVFRVRVGPFDRREEADRHKARLESSGIEAALVRVQR